MRKVTDNLRALSRAINDPVVGQCAFLSLTPGLASESCWSLFDATKRDPPTTVSVRKSRLGDMKSVPKRGSVGESSNQCGSIVNDYPTLPRFGTDFMSLQLEFTHTDINQIVNQLKSEMVH
jgi:hypothetical protein